jgi:hypothetical protein
MPYRGAHRRLKQDDEILARLEAERTAKQTAVPGQPEPTAEEVQEAPDLVVPAVGAEEESWKKRYADLRRHMTAKDNEWKAKFAELEAKLSQTATREMQLPTSEEDIAKWAEAYPDVAKIVEAIAMKQADARAKQVEEKLKVTERKAAELAKREAEMELKKLHPDVDALKNDRAFHEWAEKQPKTVQWMIYASPNFRDCASAIDLFKAQTGWGKPVEEPKRGPGRPRKEDAAVAVRVPSAVGEGQVQDSPKTRTWKESEVARLNARDFDRYEADIIAARREGRFVYDQSGASM